VPTLRDYLDTVRRWAGVVVISAVLAPVVAVLLANRQPPLYEASAKVLIQRQNLAFELQNVTDPTAFDPTRVLQTQAELARVPEVARRTVVAAGADEGPSALLGASSVTAQDNSDILTFSVRNTDPDLATRLANEYARQFARYRNELQSASIANALKSVESRLADLESSGDQDSPLYKTLLTTEEQLRTMQALQTTQAVVVREASGAGKIAPHPVRSGIVGAMLGLVLGLGIAFLAEALGTRVRTEGRVRDVLALPVLGRIARPPGRLRRQNRLVTLESPSGPEAEAFRILTTNLDFVTLEFPAKTIMITSALPQEGKTTTLANLGVLLARQGRRVTIVDLDLQSPALHRVFGVADGPGLTNVALGQASLEEAIVRVPLGLELLAPSMALNGRPSTEDANGVVPKLEASLEIVRFGTPPPDSGEFLVSRSVKGILERLAAKSNVVLIDAPPLLVSGAALALTAEVEGIIVVARLRFLKTRALRELRQALDSSPARKLGVIVTGAETTPYYGSGHPYRVAPPRAEPAVPAQAAESERMRSQ
jgi:Mrp family chromosome partitioning ATPase/capsular polysaccharide biosynthesis protein